MNRNSQRGKEGLRNAWYSRIPRLCIVVGNIHLPPRSCRARACQTQKFLIRSSPEITVTSQPVHDLCRPFGEELSPEIANVVAAVPRFLLADVLHECRGKKCLAEPAIMQVVFSTPVQRLFHRNISARA